MKEKLGRYTLRGEIGRGAMSVIHLGYDPRIRRILAIKTLREDSTEDKEQRSRFISEARAAGKLTHPGIITIFDFGIAGTTPFIAMELLDGPTLRNYVRQHPHLPLRTIINIVSQIADALDYAHRQGVVHRDIKPENIAVTSDTGNVKVMDFGIARLRDKDRPGTEQRDLIAGTPHYMSPEQIRGGKVDGRSDLYSLGVLLYWLLSGHTPFHDKDRDGVLGAILSDPIPPLKPHDPSTPDALIDLTNTLLARDPAERYQSGAELIEDLRRIDDLLAERERAWSGRRIIPIRLRWTAVMSVLVAITVALGLGIVYKKQNEAMTRLAFDYGLTLTQMLAVETAEDLLLGDHIAIQVLVNEMASNREIVHLELSDRNDVVIASADPHRVGSAAGPESASPLLQRGAQSVHASTDAQGRQFLLFDSPIHYQNHELGNLQVGLATEALIQANRTTLLAMGAILLITLITVFVGAYTLSRRLVIPIEILRQALGQITRGRFDARIRLHRTDEFERLFAAYNAMADSLEARMIAGRTPEPNPTGTGTTTLHGYAQGGLVSKSPEPEIGGTEFIEPRQAATDGGARDT